MKQKSVSKEIDELRPEYDLHTLLKSGVHGKHADSFHQGTNLVLLEPDVAEAFPTTQSVNGALRLVTPAIAAGVMRLVKLHESSKENQA